MNQADEIKHSSYTKAARHSGIWHDGIGENSRLEIAEAPARPFAGGEFLLREIAVRTKGHTGGKASILFISDLHWDGWNRKIYLALADAIRTLSIDCILFGGDLGVYSDTIDGAINWLATLSASEGKFAVAGNRESCLNWLDNNFWRHAYSGGGFRFLCNETADIGAATICGIDDYRFGTPDWTALDGVDRSRPVVSFTHNPDAAASAHADLFIGDIVLCGHTHGGQICFPLIGPLYTSSEFGRQFLHGWKTRDDGTLCLVSSGIGESGFGFVRRRLRCPREVVLLKLE